jgi:prepilin-type N-terminal cleavage/methylation domain-containing protein
MPGATMTSAVFVHKSILEWPLSRKKSFQPRKKTFHVSRLAFTLIELLVVIVVIAVLASILLPALARAKESSRSITCSNDIRQLGIASVLYSGDTGRYPSILEWLYAPGAATDLTSGKLYPYLKATAVYLCPTDKAEIDRNQPPDALSPARQHSYLMNCMMCHAHDVTACAAPAQTIMFLEGTNRTPGASPSLSGLAPAPLPPPVPAPPTSSLLFRHNARGHLLMMDTHVETMTKQQFDNAHVLKQFWYPNDLTDRLGNL